MWNFLNYYLFIQILSTVKKININKQQTQTNHISNTTPNNKTLHQKTQEQRNCSPTIKTYTCQCPNNPHQRNIPPHNTHQPKTKWKTQNSSPQIKIYTQRKNTLPVCEQR